MEPAPAESASAESAPAQPAPNQPGPNQPDPNQPGPETPTAAPAPATSAAPGPRSARNERRPRDMALSLLVLLVPIFAVVFIYRVVQGREEPVVVNPAPAIAEATRAGAFPVAVPQGLPDGWRTLSASYSREGGAGTLRIGYLSPKGAGLQLVESSLPADTLLPGELTAGARPQGTADIGGRPWQRYTARPGERALVLLEQGRTVVVIGSADEAELSTLAGALSG